MKKTLHWLDENLEEFLLVVMLAAMTLIMGIQIFSRYALGQSLSWSEEVTRFLFIWSGFLSVSYCSKKCLSIKIEQFVATFPRRGKALFKVVNHTFELIFFLYMIPFAYSYMMSAIHSGQFSHRFDKIIDEDWLEQERSRTEGTIMQYLSKGKKSYIARCQRCGRMLPVGYPFKICDPCFHHSSIIN